MRFAAVALLCAFAFEVLAATPPGQPSKGSIFLAGQRVTFDVNFVPTFTTRQTKATDIATRAGLARFAATAAGRKLLAYITAGEYEIDVSEDVSDDGAGRAPEPGLATLVNANNPAVVKTYSIVLNPESFVLPAEAKPLPGQPATPTDIMAAAWAAELLHVYFYTRGIQLPHHDRADFQGEWQTIAADLGFPGLEHTDRGAVRRRPFIP